MYFSKKLVCGSNPEEWEEETDGITYFRCMIKDEARCVKNILIWSVMSISGELGSTSGTDSKGTADLIFCLSLP